MQIQRPAGITSRQCHVSGGRFVAVISPRKSNFDLGLVHVGFVVNKVALRQVSIRVVSD